MFDLTVTPNAMPISSPAASGAGFASPFFAAICNYFFNEFITKKALPAVNKIFDENFSDKLTQSHSDISFEGMTVITPDGSMLSTVVCSPKQYIEKPIANHIMTHPDCYIIKFNGNSASVTERLWDLEQDAKDTGCRVIGFNYRRVAPSTGQIHEVYDLVRDGLAQVQYLLDNGVSAEHIILDARSLGGAIATIVAHYLHQHGYKVHIFNDRSFGNLAEEAKYMALGADAAAEGYFAVFKQSIVRNIFSLTGWELDAAKAWSAIPCTHKGHLVLDHPSDENTGDTTIPFEYSLHNTVQQQAASNAGAHGHIGFYWKLRTAEPHAHSIHRSKLTCVEAETGEQEDLGQVGDTGQEIFKKFVAQRRKKLR